MPAPSSSLLRPSVQRIWRGVGCGITVVAPLFLLLNLRAGFLRDWPVHVWIIDYYAEYFRQHGDLPTVINLPSAVGIALPVYYGCLLYPVLGILAMIMGSALALRLALVAMLAIQFGALLSAGRRILGDRGIAYTMAASVVWATYSLTNLYNRGALAEYFGTGFYVTALAFGASAATAAPGPSRRFHGWLAGFFLLLAVGAHPPTAVLAAVFLGLLGGTLAWGRRRGHLALAPGEARLVAVGLLLGGLVLAPWIYANLGPGGKLAVTQSPDGFHFRPDHCDTFWGRFAPFPYDASSLEDGINTQGAPYLEAQVNIVLLGLLLWNLELGRRCRRQPSAESVGDGPSTARRIMGVAVAWFLFLAIFSLSPWLAGHFQFLAPYIQYVYRLVSHCNAALLVAVLASGALVARQGGYQRFRHHTQLVVAVGLTTAILGLVIKMQHAAVTAAWDDGRATSLNGGQRDIARAYQVPGLVRELTPAEIATAISVNFAVNPPGLPFGSVGGTRLEMPQAGWVQTNAVVHPWLKLQSDGKILGAGELGQVGQLLAVHLDAGVHALWPTWQPDSVWRRLYRLSQVTFALVVVITASWSALRLYQLFTWPSARAADQTP